MAYLKIARLNKSLGGEPVLKDLDLVLDRGEFLVIFGPSGCGKTTLLRLIAGATHAQSGEIHIGGESMEGVEPEDRDVAMAFQSFALYPHMSAFENIASPLRASRQGEAEIRRRVGEVAELLRIGHVLDHMPRELSNGQKQRTSLARSLIKRPGLLLLDDPLRNVDAKLRYEMRIELPELLRHFDTTVIYVTQDFKEAMALGSRVAVMLDGRFRQIDAPAEIYRKPVDVEVAQLFGDPPMNLIKVRPRLANGAGATVDIAGQAVEAPGCPDSLLGRDCLVGVRPEDIALADAGIPVHVDAAMPLNVRTALLISAAGDLELTSSLWDVRDSAGLIGDAHVRVDLSRAIYFEAGRGARVS